MADQSSTQSCSVQTSEPTLPVLRVDFNAFCFKRDWPENRTVAQYKPWRLKVGQRVRVADYEGNSADAVVAGFGGRGLLAHVDVDFDSFQSEGEAAA